MQAKAHAEKTGSSSKSVGPRRKLLVSHASYLLSTLALERGDSGHALIQARNSVRILYQEWMRLERDATPSQGEHATSESHDKSATEEASSLHASCIDPKASAPEIIMGPAFWKLFHPLFRSLYHLASIYAHLGLFHETMYYAELALKIANSTNSRIHMAQCEAWIASVSLKAGKLEDAARLATQARSRLRDRDKTVLSVTLACLMAKLYHQVEDAEAEAEMLARAEDALRVLTGGASQDTTGLEQNISRLAIKDKPVRAARKPRAAPAKTRTAKAPAPETKTLAQPSVQPVVEEQGLVKLKMSVLMLRAISLLGTREWSAAQVVLERARTAVGKSSGQPLERMTMASCLIGQSLEQMAKDAVFSVIQDSTLSFPSICSSATDRSPDRLSLTKTSPPRKGRSTTTSRERTRSTEDDTLQGFLENLREARACLMEAHAIAAMTEDGSVVHKISAMLQSVAILLTAAGSTKIRPLGQTEYATFSVEMGRNLTWRRERKAIVLETAAGKAEGREWPVMRSQQESRRSSLGPMIDIHRFQRDYVDIIPDSWSVLSMSLSDNGHDLCIAKLQAGHSPFVIRLPLERASSRDADSEVFNFYQGRSEMLEIIQLANASCHDARDMTVKGAKTAWWEGREELDTRLKDLLTNIENIWLGGFKGIFSQHRCRSDLLARFQKSFQNVLDKYLPSRRQVRGKKKTQAAPMPKITLDPRILELFIGLGDATEPDVDFDEVLNDLLYFVVDILQFNGERNAYDEIDFDSMVVETFDALHAYHGAVKAGAEAQQTAHTILVLDKQLHTFPWESMPCMQGLAVSRVPSLACLRRLIRERKLAEAGPTSAGGEDEPDATAIGGHKVCPSSGAFILNPGTDLKVTQETFEAPLTTSLGPSWTRIVARAPTEAEFERALAERDVLLYFGHGSGSQYIRGRCVRRLERCRAAVLLMGCSSASLVDSGEFESSGPVWNYMMAGAPAVVGTLWDVTDRDIDRYAARVLEEWGLVRKGAFREQQERGRGKGKAAGPSQSACGESGAGGSGSGSGGPASLVEAAARARDACRFRYLTAAAVCVYGIPVYLDK